MKLCRFFRTLSLVTILLLHGTESSTSPVPKEYTNYRPISLCKPSDYVRYPQTGNDVQVIVREAINQGKTVKAFGARHSQTDIICTDGIPVDNRGLKGAKLNHDTTATFGSGVTLYEAAKFLREHGRALKTIPAFGNITLGGAVGTGSHGSSIKHTSTLSEQVVRMEIVDGKANMRTISEEEDLRAFRVHLGLLGILVTITLRTHPLYKTRAHNYVVGDEVLTNGTASRWVLEADQMSLYWFPSLGKVVVANWSIVDVDTPGDAYTADHVPSTSAKFNLIMSRVAEAIQALATSPSPIASATAYGILHVLEKYSLSTLHQQTPGFVPIFTEDGISVENPAVGYYDRMFAPTCIDRGPQSLQCLWAHGDTCSNITVLDNEVSLDLDHLPELIEKVKNILTKAPSAFPLQGILMRFSANTTTYMSNAYGRHSVHFEFYMPNRKNHTRDPSASLAVYQTIMQTATKTKTFSGRSHWGKSGMVYQSKPMLDLNLDPIARANFIAAMGKFDPNGIFMNNFGRRLKGTGTKLDSDPQATRCAMMDYCFCAKDADCGVTQTCTKLEGHDFPVCQTKWENSAPVSPTPVVYNLLEWVRVTLPAAYPGYLGYSS